MVRLKKLSGTKINNRQGTSGKRRITRNSEGKQLLVEQDIARQMDAATDWAPAEAANWLRPLFPAANADFIADMNRKCAEFKRMYPGMTLGGLREKIAASG